jgi:hypothetical protein
MEERQSNIGAWVAAVSLLLALPALYVLSIGPAAAFYEDHDPPAAVIAFYSPLIWLMNTSEIAGQVFEWYIELWGA